MNKKFTVSRLTEEQWDSCMDLIDCNGTKIGDWCVRGKNNDLTAYCVFCDIVLTLCFKDSKYAFMQHAGTVRHVTAVRTKKSSSQIQPESENIQENGACLHVKSSSASEIKLCTVNNEFEPLTEYEKKLAENRAKKQELLKSLGIDEARRDAEKLINSLKRKKARDIKKERSDPIVQRVSKRKRELVDYSQKGNKGQNLWQKLDPTEKTFENCIKFKTEYRHFVEEFSEIIEADIDIKRTPVNYYDKNHLRQLSLETSTLRISNITAMSWFPTTDDLVLAVGDGSGSLNISSLKESDFKFYSFPIHSKKISHLQANPYNPSHLVSSSYDGKVICCDIQAQIFSEVLKTTNKCCTYFDFLSASSCIVSLSNGQVMIADSREQSEDPAYRHYTYPCHNRMIYTINVHPVDKNYFVSIARMDPFIHVWDLRKLRSPVFIETDHKNKLYSVAFSPVTGKFLLGKSYDQICVYDCERLTEGRVECYSYSSYKCTDKDLAVELIRPVWLPNSDDTFACSFKNSSILRVFDVDFNSYGSVLRDGCKKIFTFHPLKCAVACASLSNKISVYA